MSHLDKLRLMILNESEGDFEVLQSTFGPMNATALFNLEPMCGIGIRWFGCNGGNRM